MSVFTASARPGPAIASISAATFLRPSTTGEASTTRAPFSAEPQTHGPAEAAVSPGHEDNPALQVDARHSFLLRLNHRCCNMS